MDDLRPGHLPDDGQGSAASPGPEDHHAELSLPAEGAYVAVLRLTAVGLAARLDFTLDDIEDLRIAVGEACALVLENADRVEPMVARFVLHRRTLRMQISVTPVRPEGVDETSFGWQVLTALTSDVSAECGERPPQVTLSFASGSSLPE